MFLSRSIDSQRMDPEIEVDASRVNYSCHDLVFFFFVGDVIACRLCFPTTRRDICLFCSLLMTMTLVVADGGE